MTFDNSGLGGTGPHPFLPSESERSPVRRLRGRLTSPVVLWTAMSGRRRGGLPVSSTLVAEGEPGHVLGLIDEETALWDVAQASGQFTVAVLRWEHRFLAEAFAGVAPAPGGPFRLTAWSDTDWGPVPAGATTWAGARIAETREVGWSLLVDGVLEHIELGDDSDPLLHRRGRYHTLDG